MVSCDFHQDCLIELKPPPTPACPVTQCTPTPSSISVLINDHDFNQHDKEDRLLKLLSKFGEKLSSLLEQKSEKQIGLNFQDFAILAISDQGITGHPSFSTCQQDRLSCILSDYLKNLADSQAWSEIQLDQNHRVSNGILQELSDLQLSRNEDSCGTKIDTNGPLSFSKKRSVELDSHHRAGTRRGAQDAPKIPNSVSDPLTSTDVIVINMFGFEISDCKELARFYKDFLSRLAIRDLKTLVKLWVTHFYGREKQRNYAHDCKPKWWPKEVKFASINSLVKRELIILATSILRFRHDNPKKNIESLAQIAKEMRWEITTKNRLFGEKVTAEVIRVARIHEDYDAGKTDGSTMVHVEALTRPKEIRGPRIKKRSRGTIESHIKALPLRDITTIQKLFTNMTPAETSSTESPCGKLISPKPKISSHKFKENTFETDEREDLSAFNLEPENYAKSLDAEAASRRTPRWGKRRMLYHNDLLSPEISSTSTRATMPMQEATNGFTPPYPILKEDQSFMFDRGGFSGMTEPCYLTMPMDLEATTMVTSVAAQVPNNDFVHNSSSSNNSNCSSRSSCSSCSNASHSWVHGYETDMKPFHNHEGLAYPSKAGNDFSPLVNELDCVFSGHAPFCDINHHGMKGRDDNGLQSSIPHIACHSLPVKHLHNSENGSYIGNDTIEADYSSSLYSSKFPLSSEGANFSNCQQQQQIPFISSGTTILQSDSESVICPFGSHSGMNDLSPLETF